VGIVLPVVMYQTCRRSNLHNADAPSTAQLCQEQWKNLRGKLEGKLVKVEGKSRAMVLATKTTLSPCYGVCEDVHPNGKVISLVPVNFRIAVTNKSSLREVQGSCFIH